MATFKGALPSGSTIDVTFQADTANSGSSALLVGFVPARGQPVPDPDVALIAPGGSTTITVKPTDERMLRVEVDVPTVEGDHIGSAESAALTAMNLKLREDYTVDSQRGLNRFNKAIAEYGFDTELTLPDPAFNRNIGVFRDIHATPAGKLISAEEWEKRKHEWLPSADDRAFVQSLMVPVTEPGKMAGWIAPPKRGIHGRPIDFDYVLFH